jgi:hypothetical protein
VIPPERNAEFVAAMEDVLDLYQRPHDPDAPVVCMDETSRQLVGEVSRPVSPAPGRPARTDYEYERKGTANVFLFTEPLRGWRWASATEQRTSRDCAHAVRTLLDVHYPKARIVRLVMDNLNVHALGSLYEAFEPAEARRLAARLEIHHTPVHGSWLNIAEIELRALSQQCLARRIPALDQMRREIAAWEKRRNESSVGVNWRFTASDARIRLRHLYPQIKA